MRWVLIPLCCIAVGLLLSVSYVPVQLFVVATPRTGGGPGMAQDLVAQGWSPSTAGALERSVVTGRPVPVTEAWPPHFIWTSERRQSIWGKEYGHPYRGETRIVWWLVGIVQLGVLAIGAALLGLSLQLRGIARRRALPAGPSAPPDAFE